VIVAEGGSEFTAVRALRLGALDYLPRKHLSGERLVETLSKTVRFVKRHYGLVARNAKSRDINAKPAPLDAPQVDAAPADLAAPDIEAANEANEPRLSMRHDVHQSLHGELSQPILDNGPNHEMRDDLAPPELAALLEVSYPNLVVKAPPQEVPSVDERASRASRDRFDDSLPEAAASQSQPPSDARAASAPAEPANSLASRSSSSLNAVVAATPPVSAERRKGPRPAVAAPVVARSESYPQIPGYTVLQRIAESDHAFVLLARQGKRKDNVALKIGKIARGTATGARAAASESLAREYETLSTLSHRSIVEIYDFGTHQGFDYLAMEYFPCGDLQRRLQNPVSDKEVIDYVQQIARALDFVHRVDLVHGDLKPQNVMLRADNSIALIDFGLVSERRGESDADKPGLVCGSPYYMSPEQTNGKRLDGRSDLYSLGVMLYEMLTGKRPFVAKSIPEIIEMHRSAPAPVLPAEHARFQVLLDQLLAKSPDNRFRDSVQLLRALESFGMQPARRVSDRA
jgi:hypothetical protein